MRNSAFAVGIALSLLISGQGTAAATGGWAADTLAAGPAEAVAVAGYWSVGNGAALRRATAFGPGNLRPAFTRTGPIVPSGEQGTVEPGHEAGYEPPAESPGTVTHPKTVGKVFFVDHEGRERWCSATSVESAHRNVVATAAHCVHDPTRVGTPMDKWVFVPAAYTGKTPYGVYVGMRAWTHHDYDTAGDLDADYAFVNVYDGVRLTAITQVTPAQYDAHTGPKWIQGGLYHTAAAQNVGRLGDVVGGQGLRYNTRPDAEVYTFGYPTGDYSGESMRYTYGRLSSRYVTADPATNNADSHVGVLSGWAAGGDGAPMLGSYNNRLRAGYLHGVVGLFVDQDRDGRYDLMTSAYFDGGTAEVYRRAAEVATGPVTG
nr:hypothetical protein [Herbidospora yilanensis]